MNTIYNEKFLISKIIDYLRFPLIIGVLFIHNYSSTILVEGEELGNTSFMPIFYIVSNFFSQVIGCLSVPIFFFISGYLFFRDTNFNYITYKYKVRKRIHTLLIPYIFWNLLHLILYYVIYKVYPNWIVGAEYNFNYIANSLWGKFNFDGITTYPISYQFWFIRDLMIMVIISPVIYYFISRFKITLIIPFLIWFGGYNIPYLGSAGISSSAILFFSLGSFYSTHNISLLFKNRNIAYLTLIIYFAIAIIDLLTKNLYYNIYIHKTGVILGIYMLFNILAILFQKGFIKNNSFLSAASFFIFAIHEPYLLSQIKKILYKILLPTHDIEITFLYFITVILTIIISLIIYKVAQKKSPSFIKIITGGR